MKLSEINKMKRVCFELLRMAQVEDDGIHIFIDKEDSWWEDEEKYVTVESSDYRLIMDYKDEFLKRGWIDEESELKPFIERLDKIQKALDNLAHNDSRISMIAYDVWHLKKEMREADEEQVTK